MLYNVNLKPVMVGVGVIYVISLGWLALFPELCVPLGLVKGLGSLGLFLESLLITFGLGWA